MLGYAGDSSYIGRSRECVLAHASAILKATQANRQVRQPPLCFPMLGILSLCHLASSADLIQPSVEQLAGVLPLLEQYVAEERAVMDKFAAHSPTATAPPLTDVQEAVSGQECGEWVCALCKGEVANLHAWRKEDAAGVLSLWSAMSSPLWPSSQNRQYFCVHCLLASKSSAHLCFAVRFYPMEQLERMVLVCSQLVTSSASSRLPKSADDALLKCESALIAAGEVALESQRSPRSDDADVLPARCGTALVAAGEVALELQRAEDERVEIRIEELRRLLPLHIVVNLPGMRPARKNPGRAVAYDEQRIREENRRQLQEAEAAYQEYSSSLAPQADTAPTEVETRTTDAADGVLALSAGAAAHQCC